MIPRNFVAPVAAPHRLEDPVGAGLQRHVQAGHDVGRLGHRLDDVVGERGRVRAREPHPLEPVDLAAGPEQLAEGEPVAELDAVGVDVLAEQRDLDDALGDERLDLGEDLAGAPVLLLAAQARDDAERAGVVAAHRDRHPAGERGVAAGGQGRREGLERLEDLDLGPLVVPGPVEQGGQAADVVGAEHDVDPRRALCTMVSRSFCAMQPPTAIWRSGLRCFAGRSWPRLPYSLLSAFSRTAQVLKTTTSATSGRSPAGTLARSTYPAVSRSPARRSESCTFIWHPWVRTS